MNTIILIMSFANFVFYPLVIGTIIAVIIEQILRRVGNPEWNDDQKMINRAMAVRKYLYRQAWIFNIVWFVGYFIIMIMLRGQAQPQMPDMIWQG